MPISGKGGRPNERRSQNQISRKTKAMTSYRTRQGTPDFAMLPLIYSPPHDSFLCLVEENSNRHRMQGLSTMVVGYDYFATLLGRGAINLRNSFRCFDRMKFSTAAQADTNLECRESEINCLRLERFVGRRCLQ